MVQRSLMQPMTVTAVAAVLLLDLQSHVLYFKFFGEQGGGFGSNYLAFCSWIKDEMCR